MWSNFDIDAKLSKIKGYKGTFMRDTAPKLKPGESMIVNTDFSFGPGIHWFAVLRTPQKQFVYLNSSGLPPIPDVMKVMTKPIFYNNAQIQENNSIACGYYAIDFVENLTGKPLAAIGKYLARYDPSPTKRNEYLARED